MKVKIQIRDIHGDIAEEDTIEVTPHDMLIFQSSKIMNYEETQRLVEHISNSIKNITESYKVDKHPVRGLLLPYDVSLKVLKFKEEE